VSGYMLRSPQFESGVADGPLPVFDASTAASVVSLPYIQPRVDIPPEIATTTYSGPGPAASRWQEEVQVDSGPQPLVPELTPAQDSPPSAIMPSSDGKTNLDSNKVGLPKAGDSATFQLQPPSGQWVFIPDSTIKHDKEPNTLVPVTSPKVLLKLKQRLRRSGVKATIPTTKRGKSPAPGGQAKLRPRSSSGASGFISPSGLRSKFAELF
jgi:hypothetical protein